jgi:hypothetical protein
MPSAFICMTDLLTSVITGVIVIGIAAATADATRIRDEEAGLQLAVAREVAQAEESASLLRQEAARLLDRARRLQALDHDAVTAPGIPAPDTNQFPPALAAHPTPILPVSASAASNN